MAAVFARALAAAAFSRRAARRTHDALLDATLCAPPSWLDRQPTGRLLQRFSGDTRAVDEDLASAINNVRARARARVRARALVSARASRAPSSSRA